MHDESWEVVLIVILMAKALVFALSIDVTEHFLREEASKLLECFRRGNDVRVACVDDRGVCFELNRAVAKLHCAEGYRPEVRVLNLVPVDVVIRIPI